MLKKWIYEGELNDQYNEFFVEEHQDIHGEDLWNLKYSMRQNGSMLPSFINTTLAKKVKLKVFFNYKIKIKLYLFQITIKT